MPVINLGPLGRLEITRTKPAKKPLPLSHDNTLATNVIDTEPPPYSAVAVGHPTPRSIDQPSQLTSYRWTLSTVHGIQWMNPQKAQKCKCRVEQLRRYLIEIIALNLGASFDALNAALYNDESIVCTNSTLSASERSELFALSSLVCKAQQQIECRESLTALDKSHLVETIIGPSRGIKGPNIADFALDLIGWYRRARKFPIPWKQTIPGYWASIYISGLLEQARESLESFKTAIRRLSPNDATHAILERALEACLQRDGHGQVDEAAIYWPVRPGYSSLSDVLEIKGVGYRGDEPKCGTRNRDERVDCMCRASNSLAV